MEWRGNTATANESATRIYYRATAMKSDNGSPADYDAVELRTGKLYRIRAAEGRQLGDIDGMVRIVKCYCRSHDILTAEEAELQKRPTFVFPIALFENLENLIGRELQGRIYKDTQQHRVRFFLDLKEHAGYRLDEEQIDLRSPWYDDSVLKE
jgi:hypothetical protein